MKRLFLAILFSGLFLMPAKADILYLKNGGQVEGLIKEQDAKSIELDLGFGTARFEKNEVEKTSLSTANEANRIRQKWLEKREKSEDLEREAARIREEVKQEWDKEKQEWEKQKLEEEARKKEEQAGMVEIPLTGDKQQMAVAVIINGNTNAELILDTGASMVMLTKAVAEKAGIDLNKATNNIEMELADGRKVQGKFINLKSIKIGEIEEQNIEAAVLLEVPADNKLKDGLLGMSFLSRFNLSVDYEKNKLLLKKVSQ